MVPLQGADQRVDIVVTQMTARVLTAVSRSPVQPGLPVRLDRSNSMLLGEVISCRQESPGEYSLLIEMNESLAGLHSLRNLVSTLLGSKREGDACHPRKEWCRSPRYAGNTGAGPPERCTLLRESEGRDALAGAARPRVLSSPQRLC